MVQSAMLCAAAMPSAVLGGGVVLSAVLGGAMFEVGMTLRPRVVFRSRVAALWSACGVDHACLKDTKQTNIIKTKYKNKQTL